jgi:hypothetical protein
MNLTYRLNKYFPGRLINNNDCVCNDLYKFLKNNYLDEEEREGISSFFHMFISDDPNFHNICGGLKGNKERSSENGEYNIYLTYPFLRKTVTQLECIAIVNDSRDNKAVQDANKLLECLARYVPPVEFSK